MSYVNNFAKRVVFNLEAKHEEEKSQLQEVTMKERTQRQNEIGRLNYKLEYVQTALALAVVLLFAGGYGWYKYPLGMYQFINFSFSLTSEFSLSK